MVSYAISQRTQEIGIRVALGARPAQVLRQVLLGGMAHVSMGIAAGLLGVLGDRSIADIAIRRQFPRSRYLRFRRDRGDHRGIAGQLPARRAATIDPMQALRSE
jgi:putative ABC transport system permease protein